MATQEQIANLALQWSEVIQTHMETVHSTRLVFVPKGDPDTIETLLANWPQAEPNIYPAPTEQQLLDALAVVEEKIAAANAVDSVKAGAKTQASAIPNYAHWTEAEMVDYITNNVTDLTSAKTVLIAMARFIAAFRNELWPDLEGN